MGKLSPQSDVFEVRAKIIDESIVENELAKPIEEQHLCIVHFREMYFQLFSFGEPCPLSPEDYPDFNYLLKASKKEGGCKVLDILREPTSEEKPLPEETRRERTA